MATYRVTVWPLGKVIDVDESQSLLTVLKAHGIYIKSSCGGVATCSDCIVKILSGENNLLSPSFAELKLLGNVFHLTRERLSCQTKIKGEVTIDISAHREDAQSDSGQSSRPFRRPIPTKLRKKAEIPAQGRNESGDRKSGDRKKDQSQSNQQNKTWFKHWEKKESQGSQNSQNPGDSKDSQGESEHDHEKDQWKKKMGGGKRPRAFQFNNEEEGE